MNAFGGKRKGRAEIREFLAKCFQTIEHREVRTEISNLRIRFVRPDVAVVMNEFERKGQKCSNGEPMHDRSGTQQRVFEKTNGKWKIVSHLIQDRTGHDLPGVCGTWIKTK